MKVGSILPMLHPLELNEMVLDGLAGMGMDSAWLPDHLLGYWHPEIWARLPPAAMMPESDAWLDAFVLGGILGRSSELMLGTAVTDPTRRRGADLARAAITLNHTCKGGFTLGLGAGEALSLLPYGYDFSRPVDQLERALRDIRSLLDTGHMPGDGVGRIGLPLEAEGRGRPPVWVGANGPRMLKLAGRYADGWFPLGVGPEQYGRMLAEVRAEASRVGRPAPEAALFLMVLFGDSKDAVRAALDENPLAKLACLFSPAELWRRRGLEHPGGPNCRGFQDVIPHALDPAELMELAPKIPIELAEDFFLTGNADEVRAAAQGYIDAGLEHVIIADLSAVAYSPEKSVQLMGEVGRLAALLKQPVGAPTS